MKKYLIIRFSSIGDIVLTSPIVRSLKQQEPTAEIHYLTKKSFQTILAGNPFISKIHTIEKEIGEIIPTLKEENFDFIIDLHHNLRTFRLKRKLGKPSAAFPKVNLQKFLLTTFKWDKMPAIHVVDRYFKAVEKLNVVNDEKGLDFFITPADHIDLTAYNIQPFYVAFAIGAQFATKRMAQEQMVELISKLPMQVVLLGGPSDEEIGNYIADQSAQVINLCGKLNLTQSASVLSQAEKVISHDTGLMHIASAFNKPIISIWGNTVPALGMYPYQPKNEQNYSIHEVDVSCRPCSKIGHQECPKKHFNCMKMQNLAEIAEAVMQEYE